MKHLILISLLSFVVFSQTPNSTTPPNEELIKHVKEQLRQKISQENNQQPKTMADVLDKSVDLVAQYTASVGDMIKKIAPEVWRIMIKQQYAKAISDFVFYPILPLIFFCYPFAMRKFFFGIKSKEKPLFRMDSERDSEGFRTVTSAFSIGICVIMLIVCFYNLSESIKLLINPEFYAIKDMLSLIK